MSRQSKSVLCSTVTVLCVLVAACGSPSQKSPASPFHHAVEPTRDRDWPLEKELDTEDDGGFVDDEEADLEDEDNDYEEDSSSYDDSEDDMDGDEGDVEDLDLGDDDFEDDDFEDDVEDDE